MTMMNKKIETELDLKSKDMETQQFKHLLIKTAFSCMASDGHIDDLELKIIHKMCEESHLFDDINYKAELQEQAQLLNSEGKVFVNNYLKELQLSDLDKEQELSIIDFAIQTIEADEEVHYSEVKFFKVIKSKLKLSKDEILERFPAIEDYLEEDIITDNHLIELLDDSFSKLGDFDILIQ